MNDASEEDKPTKLTFAALADHNEKKVSPPAPASSAVYPLEDAQGNRASDNRADLRLITESANIIFKRSPPHNSWRQIGEGESHVGCHDTDFESLWVLLNEAMIDNPNVKKAFLDLIYRPLGDNRETGFYDINNIRDNYPGRKISVRAGADGDWRLDKDRNDGSINIFFNPLMPDEAERLGHIIVTASEYYNNSEIASARSVLSSDGYKRIEDWDGDILDHVYLLEVEHENPCERGIEAPPPTPIEVDKDSSDPTFCDDVMYKLSSLTIENERGGR